ncbi:MAG: hypothetical protein AB7F89_03170 [Pirellulaceae bacterium]
MSAGLLGTVGSVTTGQLQQLRAVETDRTAREATRDATVANANRRAENAAGVGEMEQESAVSERDADGRRLWERPDPTAPDEEADSASGPTAVASLDPSGDSGTLLDLTG